MNLNVLTPIRPTDDGLSPVWANPLLPNHAPLLYFFFFGVLRQSSVHSSYLANHVAIR